MKLLINILDPAFLTGIAFIVFIICFLFIGLYHNHDYLIYIIILFTILCGTFIILNNLVTILPTKVDSLEDYIPAGLTVSKIFRLGIASIFDNASHLFEDKYFVYTFFLGLVFAITGDSMLAGAFLSSILGAFTIYFVFHIAKDLFDIKTARLTALLLALSPFYIYIASVIHRETMVLFSITWFFRTCLLYDNTKKTSYLLLSVFVLILVGLLRPAIMLVIIVAFINYMVFFYKVSKRNRHGKVIVSLVKFILVILAILAILGVLSGIINIKSIIDTQLGSGLQYTEMELINKKIGYTSSIASSSYYPVPQHDSLLSIIRYMPLLTVYFLASPFPWQIQKAIHLFALMDSAVLWVVYLLFFLEAKSFFRKNQKWAVILFTYLFFGICTSAIVQTNIGGSQRHRLMFTILMLPFAVHRLVLWWEPKKRQQISERRKFYSGLNANHNPEPNIGI